jgi:guanylate kinase
MNEFERYGNLIVISGPSGVGKSTLVNRVRQELPDLQFSISCTTRSPRPGEMHGREYYFLDREEFLASIEKNGFIEYAMYVNNYYGTPRSYVEEKLSQNQSVILEIEVQGALSIKEQYPDAILIFITAPSVAELKDRLTNRGTEAEDVIRARMQTAVKESGYIDQYEYIVCNENGKVEECVDQIHHIVETRYMLVSNQKDFIRTLKEELTDYR